MNDKEPPTLRALIGEQEAVVSRAQVLKSGLSRHAVGYRLRPGGPWQPLLPGVYLTVTGIPTLEQLEMAAMLYGGRGTVITGVASLRYKHLVLPETKVIDILIPASVRRQSTPLVTVHRTTRLPKTVTVRGLRHFALPARAVADAARDMTDLREARALVSSAVQERCCSVATIAAELHAGPRQGSALLAKVLEEAAAGTRSAPEAELRALIRKARLPMPLFNARLFLPDGTFIAKPDAWWPEAGVAVEIDSRQWHYRAADWEHTMDRHSSMGQHSIVTLHFTPHKLRTDPGFVIQRMTSAYKSGVSRPKLAIKAAALGERASGPMNVPSCRR